MDKHDYSRDNVRTHMNGVSMQIYVYSSSQDIYLRRDLHHVFQNVERSRMTTVLPDGPVPADDVYTARVMTEILSEDVQAPGPAIGANPTATNSSHESLPDLLSSSSSDYDSDDEEVRTPIRKEPRLVWSSSLNFIRSIKKSTR